VYFVETQAPQAAAQSSANLLASAPPQNSGDWENGLSFIGEGCPDLQLFDPCAETEDFAGSMSGVTFLSPLGYRLSAECTTLGVDLAAAADRIARQTEAVASFALSRELAEGTGTQAAPFDVVAEGLVDQVNPYFSDGNAQVLTAATSLLQGLGALEQAARDLTKGQKVYLHVPIVIATQVAAQLFRQGNELRTATDAVVIADAGYTGLGALDAGTQEVQTVTITGAPTGGTFTLTGPGGTTPAIAFNASATTVQTAVRTIAPGVTVTGANGGPWTVRFPATAGNVAQMTATSSLTGGTTPGVTVATTTPGVAPAPLAGVWGYATGPVFTRLSTVSSMREPATTINRRTNRQQVWADRLFVAGYDPCSSVAIKFP